MRDGTDRELRTGDHIETGLCTVSGVAHDFRPYTAPPAYPGAEPHTYWRCVWCHGVTCGDYGERDPCWRIYHHGDDHLTRSGVRWPIGGTRP